MKSTIFVPQWKSLDEHERAKYEDLALEDKERYQEECAVSLLRLSSIFSNIINHCDRGRCATKKR